MGYNNQRNRSRNNVRKNKSRKNQDSLRNKSQFSKPKKQKPSKPIRSKPIKKQKIELDSSQILLFIKYFINAGLITEEELKILTLHKDNPLKNVEVELSNKVLNKSELRDLWIYQIRNHNCFCSICGNEISSTDLNHHNPWRLTAEHRYPRSKGGKTDSTNLEPSHSKCNSLKQDFLPEVWERIGLAILQNRNIPVNFEKATYDYLKWCHDTRRQR